MALNTAYVAPFLSLANIDTHTMLTHDSLCIHNDATSRHSFLNLGFVGQASSKKDFQQFLNLNSGQEVALYLFPVSVLFLDRDWLFEIVQPNNGATAGIV